MSHSLQPQDSGIANLTAVRGIVLQLSQANVTEVCCPLWWPRHSLEGPSWHCLPTWDLKSVFVACHRMLGHMALAGQLAAPALWNSTWTWGILFLTFQLARTIVNSSPSAAAFWQALARDSLGPRSRLSEHM